MADGPSACPASGHETGGTDDRDALRPCDVAVVGGGLVGACVGYELAAAGVDVVLVDGDCPGRATDAGAGILSPQTTQHPDDRWFAAACSAAEHYPPLLARLAEDGAGDTGYARCGSLSVAVRPGDDEWFDRAVARATARSPRLLEEIDPGAVSDLFPPIGRVRRAFHNPAGARVDGRLLLAAVLHAGRGRGLRRLAARAGGFRTVGDRVSAVVTTSGDLSCGSLVLAAGSWSAPLGAELGVPLPVTPTKGQIVHLHQPAVDSTSWPIVQPVLSHYLVAWPGGRVVCGGTFEPDAGFDTRPTAAGLRQLLRECLVVAPGLAEATVVEVRVGLRPTTPDGAPLVGALPGWSNAWVATGHGPEGLLLGPWCAQAVARSITGGGAVADIALFSPERLSG